MSESSTTADRLTCQVVGCKHTIARRRLGNPEHCEWICHDHWRNVSRQTKRLRSHNKRRAKRYGWTAVREMIEGKLWERCKAEANEAALGIG